jgi:hypothetical protein
MPSGRPNTWSRAATPKFLDTFKELLPPRRPPAPARFSIDQIVKKPEDFLTRD